MQKVYATEPLDRIVYSPLKDGSALVYLRENIEESETRVSGGEMLVQWSADETTIKTELTEQEVEESFDPLWVKAENASKPVAVRLDEIESVLQAVVDMALEA